MYEFLDLEEEKMNNTTLVIMAAGMGSRFGKGIKQLEHELAYTRQEVEFLKKLRMADMEAQKEWESKHRQQ